MHGPQKSHPFPKLVAFYGIIYYIHKWMMYLLTISFMVFSKRYDDVVHVAVVILCFIKSSCNIQYVFLCWMNLSFTWRIHSRKKIVLQHTNLIISSIFLSMDSERIVRWLYGLMILYWYLNFWYTTNSNILQQKK